jgi:hypothetical protein
MLRTSVAAAVAAVVESVAAAVANTDAEDGKKEIVKIQLLKLKSVAVKAVSEHYSKQTQHE